MTIIRPGAGRQEKADSFAEAEVLSTLQTMMVLDEMARFLASASALPVLALAANLAASQVHAETCAEWMTKLAAARNSALEEVHKSGNWFQGFPGNLEVFCPKAKELHTAEVALLAFMVKNKAHCSFPDAAIAKLAGTVKHNKDFADRYCESR